LHSELKAKETRIAAVEQDVTELKALVRALAAQPSGGGQ
jgi:hypothetical protein